MIPFPKELVFHREHTWVRCERQDRTDRYRVGLDEIFLRDIGQIERLDLPNEGDEISVDEICGVIRGSVNKKLLYAPLSGEIIDVNFELFEDLGIIHEDPYGIGWILLIDPSDAEEELVNLLKGEEARQWWNKEITLRGL